MLMTVAYYIKEKRNGCLMFNYTEADVGFKIFKFVNFFDKAKLLQLTTCAEKYEYALLSGKRTDRISRIWTHQINNSSYQELSSYFDSIKTKQLFSNITGTDYSSCRTRIELCKDSKVSWLEGHTDDAAKLFTLQIYLSDSDISTNFNNIKTDTHVNCGWFFNNTGTEIHALSPLTSDRTSVIVNYVNSNWKNKEVLV